MAKDKTSKPKSDTVTSDIKEAKVKSETKKDESVDKKENNNTNEEKVETQASDTVKSGAKEEGRDKTTNDNENNDTKESSIEEKPNADNTVKSGAKKAREENESEEDDAKDDKKISLKERLVRKPKKKEDDTIEADENKDGYVSAREVVNHLDKDVKISEKSEDEILANHVAQQLAENEDYFIFKIKKSVFLMIAGLVIFLLWMIPLTPYVKSVFKKSSLEDVNLSEKVESPTPTPELLNPQRIRIKVEIENDKSASISALLKSEGYTFIDVVEVELEESGVSVVVKKGDDDLRGKLIDTLSVYKASSSSSQLTDDSDFSAAILIGE